MLRPALTALLIVTLSLPAAAQPTPGERQAAADRARAAYLDAAGKYRVNLERVLEFYEADLRRAEELVAKRRELLERGIVSRKDMNDAERQRAETQARASDARRQIATTDATIAEIAAAEQLARMPALAPGEYRELPTLIRFNGLRGFTLAALGAIQRFFAGHFGHPLPVSAAGQSPVHDRLGYDHRQAVDVAVHPDSAEGRALMDWLRQEGIPFLAFRHAITGAATGAHIHIGRPSDRLSSAR